MQRCRLSSQFSQHTTDKLLSAKRLGLTDAASAQEAGITPRTLYRWLERGRKGHPRYQDFVRSYYDAELDGWNTQLAAHRGLAS